MDYFENGLGKVTIQSIFSISNRHLITIIAAIALGGCLSDDKQESSLDSGNPSNSAPTISGNPDRAVLMGESYEFTPNASDADGDPLTFEVRNKPGWASFNSNTGRLAGTPDMGDIGDYNNIRISVSDGDASASLPEFNVTVSQTALGSVTLNWSAPTQNSDGSALVDLAGYRIYYGDSSGAYDAVVQIDNAGITTYVIDNLVPDTYFFAATAVNLSGIESDFSGEAVRTVSPN